jgi:hypothetical protein
MIHQEEMVSAKSRGNYIGQKRIIFDQSTQNAAFSRQVRGVDWLTFVHALATVTLTSSFLCAFGRCLPAVCLFSMHLFSSVFLPLKQPRIRTVLSVQHPQVGH